MKAAQVANKAVSLKKSVFVCYSRNNKLKKFKILSQFSKTETPENMGSVEKKRQCDETSVTDGLRLFKHFALVPRSSAGY